MKLLWSSRSPFVRKIVVAAHELGIADRIELERVNVTASATNAEVMRPGISSGVQAARGDRV